MPRTNTCTTVAAAVRRLVHPWCRARRPLGRSGCRRPIGHPGSPAAGRRAGHRRRTGDPLTGAPAFVVQSGSHDGRAATGSIEGSDRAVARRHEDDAATDGGLGEDRRRRTGRAQLRCTAPVAASDRDPVHRSGSRHVQHALRPGLGRRRTTEPTEVDQRTAPVAPSSA